MLPLVVTQFEIKNPAASRRGMEDVLLPNPDLDCKPQSFAAERRGIYPLFDSTICKRPEVESTLVVESPEQAGTGESLIEMGG
ncbi:MAG: hypothetical protein H7Z11_18665 [Verrucomicrobia bacterium]|nr:hypothetical protein [Leptolyngbya sp. ES-bin-22]